LSLGKRSLRPRLIVNGQLMRAFQAASAPCGVVGLLEERGVAAPFLAFRPRESLRRRNGVCALRFGHAFLGNPPAEVIQFGVTFFETSTYHLLVNPSNPVVRAVFSRILEVGYYFVFVIDPQHWTTAFRADLEPEGLARLVQHRRRLQISTTSESQYQHVVAQFAQDPTPPGRLSEWVCRDNLDYLDFTQYRTEMNPVH
jgi:hypothetical protein